MRVGGVASWLAVVIRICVEETRMREEASNEQGEEIEWEEA